MKASKIILPLLGLFMSALTYGKTIFIEYDKHCMDRYEYRYNGAGLSHIAYHILLNDREKIILEVGIENKIVRPDRPTNLRNCKDVALNEKMVRQINDGDLQVFIVRKHGNGFNVSPVGIATYNQLSATFMGFTSVDYKYVFKFNHLSADKNLALDGSESSVNYKAMLSQGCPRKYQFMRQKQRAGRSYAEMLVIPEIGVLEERTGFNETDAQNNRLVLIAVNNTPIQQYINDFCSDQGINAAYDGSFFSKGRRYLASTNTTTSGNIYDLETGTYKPGSGSDATNTTTTTTTSTNPGYVTEDGTVWVCPIYKDIDRNLYINRNTGQPAEGECGGNTYRNGKMLGKTDVIYTTAEPTTTAPATSTAPATTTTTVAGVYGKARCQDYSRDGYHIVQPNETLYGIARLYSVRVENIKKWNALRSNLITPCMKLYVHPLGSVRTPSKSFDSRDEVLTSKGEVHVVQPNETIYQLAKRYGYTTDRFREMNRLGPNERIYIGQKLKTSDCNCPAPATATTDIPQPAEHLPAVAMHDKGDAVPASYDYVGAKREVHIVKDNETIFSIAQRYNISVQRLRALNQLEENEIIIPYQRLYVN